MRFNLCLCIYFSLAFILGKAQFTTQWLVGKKISLSSYGYCVSSGPEGNIYVSGGFVGTYRSPEPTSRGYFLTCYDSQGKELWHKEYYATIGIAAKNIVTKSGDVILAGTGLKKFSSAGELVDEYDKDGVSYADICYDKSSNTILVVGSSVTKILGNYEFDETTFIARFDTNLAILNAANFFFDVLFYMQEGYDLTVTDDGYIYTTGEFGGSIKLSESETIQSAGSLDGYILKFTPQFDLVWSRSFGGPHSECPASITISKKGEIYVIGTYHGMVVAETFSTPVQQGVCDLFMIKYDTDGNLQWLKSGGGADQDKVWEMTIDDHDNIFVSGAYDSPGTFVWESSPIAAKENDKGGMFILQLDTDGNPVTWLNAQGGHFKDLICDNKGNLFATGACGSKIELAGKTLESEGGMLLAKLSYDMTNQVGLQEESFTEDLFHIFPNPGKETFNISLSDDLCPDAGIQVYETSGRCILSKRSIDCDERNFQCTVPPGLYLVELRSGSKRQTRKVIIQ